MKFTGRVSPSSLLNLRVYAKNAEEQKMPEDIKTSGTNKIG